jgi:arylformamidase
MTTIVDLSHQITDGQLAFPGDPRPSIRVHGTLAGGGYNIATFSMSTHQATHLDVPYHFFDDGKTLDDVPLERFYGPAVLVDLAPGGALAPHTPVTVEMLRPYAVLFTPGARVLLRTGWDRMFNRPEFFTDFPSLTLEAAHWIAGRRIGLLGLDLPTPGQQLREVHRALLGPPAEVLLVEGLAQMDRLPPRFTFIGLPLRLAGRDGSPIRAAAVLGG